MSDSGFTASTWFPVITLLLGGIGTAILEFLRDRRGIGRERDARNAARREATLARRIELQRETLIELQEAVAELGRFVGQTYHHDSLAERSQGRWRSLPLPEAINEGSRAKQSRINILQSRVRDEDVRLLVNRFADAASSITLAPDRAAADDILCRALDIGRDLNARIGAVLRDLDDFEDKSFN